MLQEYYSSHEPFASQSNIATIGTTASVSLRPQASLSLTDHAQGLLYLGLPLNFLALLAFPNIRRASQALGLLVLCAALVGSSFADSTDQLIVSQGVFYAIGGIVSYAPTVLFLDEWFIKRKGLAFGVVWCVLGFGPANRSE